MSSLSKRVWIWCLVLLLPLQSLAAPFLFPCVGTQASAAVRVVGPAVRPCHGAEVAVAVDPGVSLLDAAGTPSDAGHRCSVCAACCAALALPSVGMPMGTPETALHPAGPGLPRPAGVLIAGLERPPRAALR